MNKAYVTGASGFVGSRLVKFLSGNRSVTAIPRTGSALQFPEEACEGATLFHCAAIAHTRKVPDEVIYKANVGMVEAIANLAVQRKMRRVIFLSSIKAVVEESDHAVSEQQARQPLDVYGHSKAAAEDRLKAVLKGTDVSYVILRPPLVYGPGVKANFRTLLKVVSTGIPLPFRSIRNRRSFVFVDNLVDAMLAADSESADNETFHIADGSEFSTPELIRLLSKCLGSKTRLLPFPAVLLRMALQVAGKSQTADRILGSLVVEATKIHEQLGWTADRSPEQGIKETCDWFIRASARKRGMGCDGKGL